MEQLVSKGRPNRELVSIDQLENEIDGIDFDREITSGFLADAHSASLLNSRLLLLSLFGWIRRYHAARGMSRENLTRLTHALAEELRRSTPGKFAEHILSLAAESDGWQPKDVGPRKGRHEIFQSYLRLLLNHQGVEARNLILEQALEGKSTLYLHGRILEPTLSEIGRLWLENEISVADEHYATAVTEALINTLHPLLKQRPFRKGRVLLVAVQNELHALGLRMVGDFLECDGWDTIYFGPNLPDEAICSSIEKERPDLIAISVTTPANLLSTAETIQRIRAMPKTSSTPVLVGGYPLLVDHSLWRDVGADAWAANGFHAVRVARSLLKQHHAPTVGVSEASGSPTETSKFRPYRMRKPTQNEELVRLMSELSALHTQLRKRNAIIEELNEEKTRFLGMAAHDLRNDIFTATLIARLIGETEGGGLNEFQRRLLERLDSVLTTMLDLVDGYLDVSRIEAGGLEIHPEPTDLVALIEDRLSVARFFGDKAGVRVFRSGITGSATANVDPKRISQALNNLLVNAIKFSPQGGAVEVAVREEAERYVIDVMDEGPGIPSQQSKRLFNPFTTLEMASGKKRSGTGLGLHIAKRVIEAHGGSIGFHPRTPLGSVFSIAIPRFLPEQKS
jgi:MerR family transcriptional regulator, light-induced transcriptional regulator